MYHERILITGGEGFIGRNLVNALMQQDGILTIAGGRKTVVASHQDSGQVIRVRADLLAHDELEALFERHRPTRVANLAAYGVDPEKDNPQEAYAVNVEGTLRLVDLAARFNVRRFVHIGSCAEYGRKAGTISEDAPLAPVGTYADTKAVSTLKGTETANSLDLDFVTLRLFGAWGPGEATYRLVPSIRAGKAAQSVIELSAGTQIRDFSYAPELARTIAHIALEEARLPHSVINVGTGIGITVRDFALRVARTLSADALLRFGALEMRQNEVPSVIADVSRLRRLNAPVPSTDIEKQVLDLIEKQPGHATWNG